MAKKNRNTVFPHLSYELAFSALHNLEDAIEAGRLSAACRRQIPIATCTIVEQFCQTKKKQDYEKGEPMPKELKLNASLLLDMLDYADSWASDKSLHHAEVLQECVGAADTFTIGMERLKTLIDDACDIRPPSLVESLAASTRNFQSVEAVNSLYAGSRILDALGVDEYQRLFDLRHASTHTLAGIGFSPRACIGLARDLFEAVLGIDDFRFYGGCAFSESGRHARAVESLGPLNRCDMRFLVHLGRSLAHVRDDSAPAVLQKAAASLREYAETPRNCAAWRRMEAARAACDVADGFWVAGGESHVNILDICSDSADACMLAGGRLDGLGYVRESLDCLGRAFDLAESVDAAYNIGMAYFRLGEYESAEEWLKRAKSLDGSDADVRLALDRVGNHLPRSVERPAS